MLEATEKYKTTLNKLEGDDSRYLAWFRSIGPPTSKDCEKARAFMSFF